MSDRFDTFEQLQQAVAAFVAARDWEQFHNPKNLAMALAVEAAELMELLQWLDDRTAAERSRDGDLRDRLAEELADVMIYGASLANALELDLGAITASKIRANELKYPVESAQQLIPVLRGDRNETA